MLVKIHDTLPTNGDDAAADAETGPLLSGQACAAGSCGSGNMLLSKLTANYSLLRSLNFTTWKFKTAATYGLKDVEQFDSHSAHIVDELVKCTAFSECNALPIAPSQGDVLQAAKRLQLQGYVAEGATGWYLTQASRDRIQFSRGLCEAGEYMQYNSYR